MKLMRFVLWNIGIRLCDVIGTALDRTVFALPVIRDHLGACMVLHGVTPRFGTIPESWWRRAGWRKP